MTKPKKILVISNEKILYHKLNTLMTREGFEICCAFSNDPTIKSLIEETNPRLIVVDPEIPGMNGVKLSLLIRQWSPAPILMISPAQSGPEEIRVLDVASEGWISEPLGVELVAVRVNALV